MRRLLKLAVAALALACAPAASAAWQPVYIQNHSTVLSAADLRDALPAFQAAATFDFAPMWNADAKLVLTDPANEPIGWSIELVDNAPCLMCAGYHDVDDNGIPYAVVGVDDPDWQGTFTHELFEVLADPYVNRGVLVRKRWYALEVCDPVEDGRFEYTRPSATGKPVRISDFILEAWFRPGSHGPYDFTGHVRRPLQILAGGYQLIWTQGDWLDFWTRGTRIPRY